MEPIKKFKLYYVSMVLGSLAFTLGIQFVLHFPYGLIVGLITFIALPSLLRKVLNRKFKDLGLMIGDIPKMQKECMSCGYKTNHVPCPRCGRNQFKFS